jgi:D-tyrosyl-tRNA(Tyr) deacylase
MRAVIQKVSHASITIDNDQTKQIGHGLVILLGIETSDDLGDIQWLSGKISRLRIFNDQEGVMNLSVRDVGGEIMIVSQFTLHASTKKGNRPSYIKAAPPEIAIPLYEDFIGQMEQDLGKTIVTGEFGAYMQVNLTNDGPVTISIDTKNKE